MGNDSEVSALERTFPFPVYRSPCSRIFQAQKKPAEAGFFEAARLLRGQCFDLGVHAALVTSCFVLVVSAFVRYAV